MSCLEISGIRAYGYIGALAAENELGQWFEVDLTLWLDLDLAASSDRLADTYDYCQAVQATQALIRTSRFRLIERLADAIATTTLATDPRLGQIKVRLTKLTPPIADFDGQITVELMRSQLKPL